MVLIDAVKHGVMEPLLDGHNIGVAEVAAGEVCHWKDAGGTKRAIDLTPYVHGGKLTVVAATAAEMAALLSQTVSTGLGASEIESLAVVLGRRWRYCTGEARAVEVMQALGVFDRWVRPEELATAMELGVRTGRRSARRGGRIS